MARRLYTENTARRLYKEKTNLELKAYSTKLSGLDVYELEKIESYTGLTTSESIRALFRIGLSSLKRWEAKKDKNRWTKLLIAAKKSIEQLN